MAAGPPRTRSHGRGRRRRGPPGAGSAGQAGKEGSGRWGRGRDRLGWARCLPPLLRTGGASRSGSGPGRALRVTCLVTLGRLLELVLEAARFHKSSFCGTLAEQQAETRRFECNFQRLRPALLSKTPKSYAAGVLLPCVRTHTQRSGHAWNSVS